MHPSLRRGWLDNLRRVAVAFRLFGHFEDVARATAQPEAQSFYALLDQMRGAVRSRSPAWADYPNLVNYAQICFWAIRRLEYSFAAESFAALERTADRPLRVLDAGCGVVPFCNWMSRRGHTVFAIDPLKADIEFLLQNDLNGFYGSAVTYSADRCEALPFEDASFDVVTCISVLEHIPPGNDRAALWEMGRVLKPGGSLILTTDIAPPPAHQDKEEAWPPELRRYAAPFTATSARALLRQIAPAFGVTPADLPDEVNALTWQQVHDFWRMAQAPDGREEPEREYLAIGGALPRAGQWAGPRPADVLDAYLDGQAALEDRLWFFQQHAEQRLELVQRLNADLAALRPSLEEKERMIASLTAASEERLDLSRRLEAQVESARAELEAVRAKQEVAESVAASSLAVIREQDRNVEQFRTAAAERLQLVNQLEAELKAAQVRADLKEALIALESRLAVQADALEQQAQVIARLEARLGESMLEQQADGLPAVEARLGKSVLGQQTDAKASLEARLGESVLEQHADALARLEARLGKSVLEQHAEIARRLETTLRQTVDTRLAAQARDLGALQNRLEDLQQVYEAARDGAEAIAEARLHVIEEQARAIDAYRRARWRDRLKRWVAPRLGVLYQYNPRPLLIPPSYRTARPPAAPPLFSIVTPSYNQGRFLERTIKSVFDQGYPSLEYIIQDGGSRDESQEILERYRPRLKHVASAKDSGFVNAINRGFAHATGEIMAYLNSDDLLLPGALSYVANYFVKHPDVDVVYGHRVVIDEYDAEIGRWVLPPHNDAVLSWADYVPQETLFWRRRVWDTIGGSVDESFRFAVDWDLLVRLRDAGAKFARLPRFLGAFRVHPHQKTSAEMAEVGEQEMARIRERCHGSTVSHALVYWHVVPYLRWHVVYNKLYRAGILRY
jgi:glycosyltransferase involved in cell wall biosynthesis/2-polyprenyl-3-methyl-5-hydroxy-6-metoxy-1,4-benzoquinol methylase